MNQKFIQGATLIFWGLQTEMLLWAVPMAILLEYRHFWNKRWDLEKTDFYRIGDLSIVGLVGLSAFLYLGSSETHILVALLQLMPLVFFPLVTVLAYSTADKIGLDILIYSLRKQPDEDTEWDLHYLYVGLCLISAGTVNEPPIPFLPGAAMIICWSLLPFRSSRYHSVVWPAAVFAVIVSGALAQHGLREAHLAMKAQAAQWFEYWIGQRTDPYKTTTRIGAVGRLKLSDNILFRVAPIGDPEDLLLQEASYNFTVDADWMVLKPNWKELAQPSEYSWEIYPETPTDKHINVYYEFSRRRALLPLPSGTSRIDGFPASILRQSEFGTVSGTGILPTKVYQVIYNSNRDSNLPPANDDVFISTSQSALMKRHRPDVTGMTDSQKVEAVERFFSGYKYSLYQPELDEKTNPLAYFLEERKAGHCEYFATATAMMLRALDIPSRYVVGFSVQEFHPSINAYVVRSRHAHAWVIAWVNKRWQVVDTTPSIWLETEADQSSILQPLFTYLSNNFFSFALWWDDQRIEDYQLYLYIIAFVLVIVLAWRLWRSEQVTIVADAQAGLASNSYPGQESPFYLVESALQEKGLLRHKGESLRNWLHRIRHNRVLPLLDKHYSWRFDPNGISSRDKETLTAEVTHWLAAQSRADDQKEKDKEDEKGQDHSRA